MLSHRQRTGNRPGAPDFGRCVYPGTAPVFGVTCVMHPEWLAPTPNRSAVLASSKCIVPNLSQPSTINHTNKLRISESLISKAEVEVNGLVHSKSTCSKRIGHGIGQKDVWIEWDGFPERKHPVGY